MISARSLLYWFFMPLLCLCFLSACKGQSEQEDAGNSTPASQEFAGEPSFTADVHFLAGQIHESKATSRAPNGGLPAPAEVAGYQAAALNQYAAALKLDPKHTPSLYRSAIVLGEMGRHEQAFMMWQQYVQAVGRTPDSLVNLGIASEMANQAADAATAYREAMRRDPHHIAAHVNLGVLLARQGKIQPAQEALAQVLVPAAVHWHLGAGLAAGGYQREADEQFRAAANLDPAFSSRPNLPSGTARVE